MHPLLTALTARGWIIESSATPLPLLPPAVARRYPKLPIEVVSFLSSLAACRNQAKTSWFLTFEDYARSVGPGFRWNEYECMALEDFTEPGERAAVVAFWDCHFPFMLAVHSDYDYLAVALTKGDFGSIVHGYAPEWQDPSPIFPSFSAFMEAFWIAAASPESEYPLSVFF